MVHRFILEFMELYPLIYSVQITLSWFLVKFLSKNETFEFVAFFFNFLEKRCTKHQGVFKPYLGGYIF